jgi:nitroreductase
VDAVECMKSRRSIRSYHHRPIPREIIGNIVDCGRLAATAINIQPWLFIAVEDEELRRRIAESTDYGKFIADAPVCIAVFCRKVKYFVEDGSAATQNILNAARALGLASCWVAGHQKPYAAHIRDLLGVPAEYQLVSLVPVGYGAEDPNPQKRPLSDVLRWNHY